MSDKNSSANFVLVPETSLPPHVRARLREFQKQNGSPQALTSIESQQTLGELERQRIQAQLNDWYARPSVKRPEIQPGKYGFLTSWYYNAPFGQPRGVNITTLRRLAQSAWVNMCVTLRVNELATLDWDIVPEDKAHPNDTMIADAREILEHPNQNQESFTHVMKAFLRDLFELDAGVLVKTFAGTMQTVTKTVPDIEILDPEGKKVRLQDQWKCTKFTSEVPTKAAKLEEFFARDGASFLKETDPHGLEFGYYQYSFRHPAAQPIPFSKREIIYAISNPLSYSAYGWSPLLSIDNILNTLIYSLQYNEDLFEKNGVPKGILAISGMGKGEFDIFESHFHEQHRENPHGLPMLGMNQPGGKAQWIPFTPTMDDLRFLESQEWYLKLVAANMEVNFNELGFTDTINRATSEEQSQVFKRRSIRPLLKTLEYWINLELISELKFLGIEGVQFKFIPLIDSFEHARRTAVFVQEIDKGLRTVNEIRTNELGLDPIDEEWANMPPWVWQALPAQQQQPAYNPYDQYVPPTNGNGEPTEEDTEEEEVEPEDVEEEKLTNMVRTILKEIGIPQQGGSVTREALADVSHPPNVGPQIQVQLDPAADPQMVAAQINSVAQLALSEDPKPVGNDSFYDLPNPSNIAREDPRAMTSGPLEQEFSKELEVLFATQEAEVLKELGLLQKTISLDKVQAALQALTQKHFGQLLQILRRFILRALHRGGNKAHKELQLSASFELADPDAERFMQDYSAFLAHSKFNQVRARIRDTLIKGIQEGLGATEIGKQIQKEFSSIKGSEAERIARTEVMRAMNYGREMGYKRSGLVERKQWLVAWDDRLCSQCRPMANKSVILGEAFVTPDGLRVQNPPLHPNCRCTVVPILKKDVGKGLHGFFTKSSKMQEIETHYGQEILPLLQGWLEQEMSLQDIADKITAEIGSVTKMSLSNWTRAMGLATLPAGKVNQHTKPAPTT